MSDSKSVSSCSEGELKQWGKRRARCDQLGAARNAKKSKMSEGGESPAASQGNANAVSESVLEEELISLETAQEMVDDWVTVLPVDQRRELAVTLFVTFRRRHKMGIMDAAQEAASVTGFNERTVRRLWKEWSENDCSFDEKKQGQHLRPMILDDEECRERALQWIRAKSVKEGQQNMTARLFAVFVNDELLPNICLLPGLLNLTL